MSELVRKLGVEKKLNLTKHFDLIVDKYRKIADASGYHGELRFKKEGGFTVVFVQVNK
jgi:hypothetical protein